MRCAPDGAGESVSHAHAFLHTNPADERHNTAPVHFDGNLMHGVLGGSIGSSGRSRDQTTTDCHRRAIPSGGGTYRFPGFPDPCETCGSSSGVAPPRTVPWGAPAPREPHGWGAPLRHEDLDVTDRQVNHVGEVVPGLGSGSVPRGTARRSCVSDDARQCPCARTTARPPLLGRTADHRAPRRAPGLGAGPRPHLRRASAGRCRTPVLRGRRHSTCDPTTRRRRKNPELLERAAAGAISCTRKF